MQGLVCDEAEKKTPRQCGAFIGFVRRSRVVPRDGIGYQGSARTEASLEAPAYIPTVRQTVPSSAWCLERDPAHRGDESLAIQYPAIQSCATLVQSRSVQALGRLAGERTDHLLRSTPAPRLWGRLARSDQDESDQQGRCQWFLLLSHFQFLPITYECPLTSDEDTAVGAGLRTSTDTTTATHSG